MIGQNKRSKNGQLVQTAKYRFIRFESEYDVYRELLEEPFNLKEPEDVSPLKSEVGSLKSEISSLKSDVVSLRAEINQKFNQILGLLSPIKGTHDLVASFL